MLSGRLFPYFQRTTNLCVLQLDKEPFTPSLSFPHATTLTLINCSRKGVSRILTPSIFPNLTHIHYLSGHPGQVDVYRRFTNPLQWVFPNRKHPFYEHMIDSGQGRVENRLIGHYIHTFHDSGMVLNLPGYGFYEGQGYVSQLKSYFNQPCVVDDGPRDYAFLYEEPFGAYPNVAASSEALPAVLQKRMERAFFARIMKESH